MLLAVSLETPITDVSIAQPKALAVWQDVLAAALAETLAREMRGIASPTYPCGVHSFLLKRLWK